MLVDLPWHLSLFRIKIALSLIKSKLRSRGLCTINAEQVFLFFRIFLSSGGALDRFFLFWTFNIHYHFTGLNRVFPEWTRLLFIDPRAFASGLPLDLDEPTRLIFAIVQSSHKHLLKALVWLKFFCFLVLFNTVYPLLDFIFKSQVLGEFLSAQETLLVF